MEILNNFASIPCFITFVLGAVFMLAMIIIAAMRKVDKPMNKVRFYVTTDATRHQAWIKIWIGKPVWDNKYHIWTRPNDYVLFLDDCLSFQEFFNIKPTDFNDMKPKEIREVFINIED